MLRALLSATMVHSKSGRGGAGLGSPHSIRRIIPASEPKVTIDRSVGLETSADKPKRRGKNSK